MKWIPNLNTETYRKSMTITPHKKVNANSTTERRIAHTMTKEESISESFGFSAISGLPAVSE